MELDFFKVKKSVSESLQRKWSHLTFNYELGEDDSLVICNKNLTMCGDGVALFCTVYSNGEVEFRTIFDRIELDIDIANLINEIQGQSIFQVYINSKSYLIVCAVGYVVTEDEVGDLFTHYLSQFARLSHVKEMKEITELTY